MLKFQMEISSKYISTDSAEAFQNFSSVCLQESAKLSFKEYIYIYIYIWGYICVFYLKQCEALPTLFYYFHIIPGGFCYLPCEKFTARSHPGKIF